VIELVGLFVEPDLTVDGDRVVDRLRVVAFPVITVDVEPSGRGRISVLGRVGNLVSVVFTVVSTVSSALVSVVVGKQIGRIDLFTIDKHCQIVVFDRSEVDDVTGDVIGVEVIVVVDAASNGFVVFGNAIAGARSGSSFDRFDVLVDGEFVADRRSFSLDVDPIALARLVSVVRLIRRFRLGTLTAHTVGVSPNTVFMLAVERAVFHPEVPAIVVEIVVIAGIIAFEPDCFLVVVLVELAITNPNRRVVVPNVDRRL